MPTQDLTDFRRDCDGPGRCSAAQLAASGDTVLLAPAAASMDQFSSYAHRGDAFIEAVRELVEGQAQTSEE